MSSHSSYYLDMVSGLRLIQDSSLTVTELVTKDLNWKERLTSWPWRPHVKTREFEIQVASPSIFRAGNLMICHPELYPKVVAALFKQWDVRDDNLMTKRSPS